MKRMSIDEVASALGARLLKGQTNIEVDRVSTDTRTLRPGDLFVALAGENFDAHNFLDKAVSAGAAALILHREVSGLDPSIPVLLVGDTLESLQQLAAYNRRQFDIPVIGVTGSNGKTTTKDMIAAVLEGSFKTLKTKGNFNNHIGLPLTLLELDHTYRAVVVEMGMRGLGEIDLLASLARPTIGVITNIGETHLERLGTIDNIARAKGEILGHVEQGGLALLNGDNDWVRKAALNFNGQKVFYGFDEKNDVRAMDIATLGNETGFTFIGSGLKEHVIIPVLGRHNVINALAAIAIGLELKIPFERIKEGLANLQLTGMRLEVIDTPQFKIINDAYNANPASMKEALAVLGQLAQDSPSIAVLGNMFELGEREAAGHWEVGEAAASVGISSLITVGDLARNIGDGARSRGMSAEQIYHCNNNLECVEVIGQIAQKGDVILVKGSRGMKMEEIVKALKQRDSH